MDLVGAVMALVGLLTIFSLFSANRSALSGTWVKLLAQGFGWGMYLLPLGLVVLGAWLVARKVERLPALSPERLVGIVMLFVGLLVAFHGLSGSAAEALERAEAGQGGGYLGALLQQGLVNGLGGAGAVILVAAWLVIAMAMTLDLSMNEMFRWAAPLARRLGEKLPQRGRTSPGGGQAAGHAPQPGGEELGEFTPLTATPAPAQPAAPLPVTARMGAPSAPAIAWALPRIGDILEKPQAPVVNDEFIEKRARLIEETLASFGAPGMVVEISRGPAVTMFGVEPQFTESRGGPMRVRVGKIASLSDDLALALAAPRIRIQAPVPGRGYVGIEVPNEETTLVALREVVENEVFTRGRMPLRFALGKDVAGQPRAANLEVMPHLLIAGTTGSGKSVCITALAACLAMNNPPEELRLVMIDSKMVELIRFNGLPHLYGKVETDIQRIMGVLRWVVVEMEHRYKLLEAAKVRDVEAYNRRLQRRKDVQSLPRIVVMIDELADLMMSAPDQTEHTLVRLAQMARATGIHLVVATQRPSTDVVTGLIKANFPARLAFAVPSGVDSRVILDLPGAETLLGRGDMLFLNPEVGSPVRAQGVIVTDQEIERLIAHWQKTTPQKNVAPPWETIISESDDKNGDDVLIERAIHILKKEQRASASLLQRRLNIGYPRAARLLDQLEEMSVVGPSQGGGRDREVLMEPDEDQNGDGEKA